MPVRKTNKNGKVGYKYGNKGKVYSNKKLAERQGVAIRLSQLRRGKKVK